MKKSHQVFAFFGFTMLFIGKIIKKILVLAFTLAVFLLPVWMGLAFSCDSDDDYVEYKALKNIMQSDVVYVKEEFFKYNDFEIPTKALLYFDNTKIDKINSDSGYNENVFAYNYVTNNYDKLKDWNITINIKCDKKTEEYKYIDFDTGETRGEFRYKEIDDTYYIDCEKCVMIVGIYIDYSHNKENDYDYESKIKEISQSLIRSLIDNIEDYDQL